MEWIAFAIVAAVILLGRLLVARRWRANRISTRSAAVLFAALPAALIPLAFAITGGVRNWADALLLLGGALFIFGSTFATADFIWRAMNGEMDATAKR